MNGKALLKAVSEIDEELILEADEAEFELSTAGDETGSDTGGKKMRDTTYRGRFSQSRSTGRRWISAAVAACLCFLLGGGVVLASSMGINITDLFSRSGESGYEMEFQVNPISEEKFTGPIQNVKEVIRQQYEEQKDKPYLSSLPGSWSQKFATWEEAVAFLGADFLENPIAETYEEKSVTVQLYADQEARFQYITVESVYEIDGCRIQQFHRMYMQDPPQGKEVYNLGAYAAEYVEFTASESLTAQGRTVMIVESTPMESGAVGMDCYMVEGSVIHNIHLVSVEGDQEKIQEVLEELLTLY